MAKSARAKSRKANNTALRARVFGPVDEARTSRLSAKLMALAAQPKPSETAEKQQRHRHEDEAMDVETELKHNKSFAADNPDRGSEDMEIDGNTDNAKTTHKKSSSKRSNRIQKKHASRRTKSSTTFPSFRGKGKGKTAGKRSKTGKH